MADIHEEHGYETPELTTIYLGIFEANGVWQSAREMRNNKTGRTLKVPNTLEALARMTDATMKYEGGQFLAVEIQPLADLTFQHFRLAGLREPTDSEGMSKGLSILAANGIIAVESVDNVKRALVAHRDQWADRREIRFFAGWPPEPVKPTTSGVAGNVPGGKPK